MNNQTAKIQKDGLNNYLWQGANKNGEKRKGEITARSVAIARSELRKQGITPKVVKKKTQSIFSKGKKKIRQQDIALFTRQLATMLKAGIPLIQSFDIISKGLKNPSLQSLLSVIKTEIETGSTLAESLKKHPNEFNALYCNLIDAGEQSGCLESMLDKVASYKEKIESLKGKIKKALFYPTAVVIIAFVVTAALLIFVVPQFESLFKGFGADLPTLTLVVVRMSEAFQSYWWIIFGGIGAIIWGFIQAKKRSQKFSEALDYFVLKIQIIGPILEKSAIARFCRTLSVTFAAGLPLVDALKSVAGATGNSKFSKATLDIRDDVSTGQQLQMAMKMTQCFPNMVIQMVAIGEESGSLELMLSKVADFYEEEVDNAVDGLSTLLEPIIMAVLGILVGGLVIAMYLPIFKLGSVV